eukprot:8826037-Lingulodinium_polyedra.AAC.1
MHGPLQHRTGPQTTATCDNASAGRVTGTTHCADNLGVSQLQRCRLANDLLPKPRAVAQHLQ